MISRTTAPEGEVTMPMRCGSRGMGRLRAASNRPSRRQLLLQLLEGELQRAVALRLDGFHQKLILAARFVDIDVAARQHRHPVLRLELQIAQRLAEAHAAQLRVVILQREVAMAAGGGFGSRDLARHPDVVELIAQKAADARVQFGDGERFADRAPG